MSDAILVGVGRVKDGGEIEVDWSPAKWYDMGYSDGSNRLQFLPSFWMISGDKLSEYVSGYVEGAYLHRMESGADWQRYAQACDYLDGLTAMISDPVRKMLLAQVIVEHGELP